MPLPTVSDVHVDELATNMSLAWIQDAGDFGVDQVFPRVPVKKQSGLYTIWDKGDFMRIQMKPVGDGDKAPVGGYTLDNTPNYFCLEYALKKLVTDKQRANATKPINPEKAAIGFLNQQARMLRAQKFIATAFAASVWTTDYTGVASGATGTQLNQWDQSGSTPIEDVRALKRIVHKLTGRRPNRIAVGPEVHDALMDHSDVLDRIKYTQGPAIPDEQLMAQLFDVKHYVILQSVYNSAAEGATTSMAFQAGKHVLIAYAPEQPELDEPSAGYQMIWEPFDNLSLDGAVAISRWREDDPRGDWLKSELGFTTEVTSADCAAFCSGIVS